MVDLTLTKTRIRGGIWEGILAADTAQNYQPDIEVLHLEQPLSGVQVIQTADMQKTWGIKVPIPADLLADGVQTFLIRDKRTGTRLDSFTIITGAALEDDIRAEIDLLRAELDMLKKAFRRHCLETAG